MRTNAGSTLSYVDLAWGFVRSTRCGRSGAVDRGTGMQLPDHKTKIVATIGPASAAPGMPEKLLAAGMDVARLNLSHGDLDRHAQTIEQLRAAARTVGRPLAIVADLPGPNLRFGRLVL
jgi:hypothetical protein